MKRYSAATMEKRRAYARAWHQKYGRAYQAARRERRNAVNKEWKRRNAEKLRLQRRRRYAKHRARLLAYGRAYTRKKTAQRLAARGVQRRWQRRWQRVPNIVSRAAVITVLREAGILPAWPARKYATPEQRHRDPAERSRTKKAYYRRNRERCRAMTRRWERQRQAAVELARDIGLIKPEESVR